MRHTRLEDRENNVSLGNGFAHSMLLDPFTTEGDKAAYRKYKFCQVSSLPVLLICSLKLLDSLLMRCADWNQQIQ